jgi:hypothetical protein
MNKQVQAFKLDKMTQFERRMRRLELMRRQGGKCSICAQEFKADRYAVLVGSLADLAGAYLAHGRCHRKSV